MAKKSGGSSDRKLLMYHNIMFGKYLIWLESFVDFIVIFVVVFLFLSTSLNSVCSWDPHIFGQWKMGLGVFGRAYKVLAF